MLNTDYRWRRIMKLIYNILVIIDPQQDNTSILNRTTELAKAINAQVHLLICSQVKDDEPLLRDLALVLQQQGLKVSFEIAWNDSSHKTITQIQKEHGFGLVLKMHRPTKSIKNVILTPEDWKLLRTCACPLLIINQNKPWQNRPILTSVDLGNPNENYVELHNTLLKAGYALTQLTKGELHLLSVYPAPIFSEIYLNREANIPTEIYKIYHELCKEYQLKYNITQKDIHLHSGAPDIVIPQVAESIDAAVCVIGTVARTGISGMLIGNTAEAILDDLTCDILVIKPDGISEELEQLILCHL